MESSRSRGVREFWAKRPFEDLGRGAKRLKVIEEQEGKCLICRIAFWQGKLLILALDHIDGDHQNYTRENLRAICPNCHSQTITFGFKGRTHTEENKKIFVKQLKQFQGG